MSAGTDRERAGLPRCRVVVNVLTVGCVFTVGSAAGTFGLTDSRGVLPMMRAAGNDPRGYTFPPPRHVVFPQPPPSPLPPSSPSVSVGLPLPYFAASELPGLPGSGVPECSVQKEAAGRVTGRFREGRRCTGRAAEMSSGKLTGEMVEGGDDGRRDGRVEG
jgi:hypothetical protein